MKKRKIYVYAITKNEEKFAKRWYDSMKEADHVYVLDTGSTDDTVSILEKLGATVKTKIINPWRFDVARNESLKLVPEDADICVCTDLDEVIEPGWRKKLEEIWEDDTSRLRYNYNWSFDEHGNPAVNFYIEKIHSRKNYEWTHPVHEVLSYKGNNEVFKTTDEITVNHYPDNTKSRGSYLSLLELSVKEDPEDDRNTHYLGREYMFHGRWNESIDTLIKHLSLKKATWKDERCASMRFIARCYKNLRRYEEARMWLEKAINEAPYLRDPYVEMALLEYETQNWSMVKKYCEVALNIKSHTKSYINEPFSWNYTVYDLLAISSYYLSDYVEAEKWSRMALNMEPDNERLKNNYNIIKQKRNATK